MHGMVCDPIRQALHTPTAEVEKWSGDVTATASLSAIELSTTTTSNKSSVTPTQFNTKEQNVLTQILRHQSRGRQDRSDPISGLRHLGLRYSKIS